MKQPLDIESLLGQQDWMRRLASRLAGDEGMAEDVTQETLLLAWGRGPALPSDRGALRAWIGAVLRRKTKTDLRAERRRRMRELGASRPEAQGSVADALMEMELQSALAEAVAGLPERAREIVVLRYYDNLSPRSIAQRLDLTPKQVQDQLHRGLRLLREELQGGERSPLASRFGLSAFGLALMKPAVATVLTVVAVLALARWALQSSEALAPDLSLHRVAEVGLDTLVEDSKESVARAGGAAPARSQVVQPERAGEEKVEESAPPTAALALARVRVHVVDGSTDRPVAGISVKVVPAGRDLWATEALVTNAQGVATWSGDAGRLWVSIDRVCVSGNLDSSDLEVALGETTEYTFRLGPGGSIAGRVVDYSGRPVEGATIWLGEGNGMPFDGSPCTTSGEGGEFEIAHLSTYQSVAAYAPGLAASRALVPLMGHEGSGPAPCELVLNGIGGKLIGRMVGPDGQGQRTRVLVGADQSQKLLRSKGGIEYAPPPRRLWTDDDGRFEVEGLAAGDQSVQARARGIGTLDTSVSIQAGSTTEMEFVLSALGTLRGAVRLPDGSPAAEARVQLGSDRESGELFWSAVEANAKGEFSLSAPAGGRSIDVWTEDHPLGLKAEVEIVGGQVTRWIGALPEVGIIQGRVQDETGVGLTGFRISHQPTGTDTGIWSGVWTDGAGSFEIPVAPDASLLLRVQPPGQPFSEGLLDLPGATVEGGPYVVTVSSSDLPLASLLGRVVDGEGNALAARKIECELTGSEPMFAVLDAESDDFGVFRIDYLPPGDWLLRIEDPDREEPWKIPVHGLGLAEVRDLGDLERDSD